MKLLLAHVVAIFIVSSVDALTIEHINPPPAVAYIAEGAKLELACTGNQLKGLKWYHREKGETTQTELYSNNSIGLTLPTTSGITGGLAKKTINWLNVPLSASGDYTCKNDDASSETATAITVVKVTVPDFEITNQTSQTLVCTIDGLSPEQINNKDKVKVAWKKNNKLLPDDEAKYVNTLNNVVTLEIKKLGKMDAGEYRCEVEITENQRTVMFSDAGNGFRKVEVEPFFGNSESKNYIEGDKLTLTCKVSGHTITSINWFLDDKEIANSKVSFSSPIDSMLPNNTILSIKELEESDRGHYSCVAFDNNSMNSTAKILIRVKDKLAALWPFLGICAEVAVLCLIIFFYERRRSKQLEQEDQDAAVKEDLLNSHGEKSDDVRKRTK